MKKFLLVLLALALPVQAFATKGPYNKETDARFRVLEVASGATADQAEQAGISRKFARLEYDVSVDGGGSSPSTHSLGVTLPAGAVVTSLLVYVNTTFSGGAQSESVALQCNAGERDLMDWQDIGAFDANSVIYGGLVPTAAVAGYVLKGGATPAPEQVGVISIPTACVVKALVRDESGYTPYTAGKFTAVIEYFNKD